MTTLLIFFIFILFLENSFGEQFLLPSCTLLHQALLVSIQELLLGIYKLFWRDSEKVDKIYS